MNEAPINNCQEQFNLKKKQISIHEHGYRDLS